MKPLETVTVHELREPKRMLFYGFGVVDGTTAALVSDIDCSTGFSIRTVKLCYVKFDCDPHPAQAISLEQETQSSAGDWTITTDIPRSKYCVAWNDFFSPNNSDVWRVHLRINVPRFEYYATHPELHSGSLGKSVPVHLHKSLIAAIKQAGFPVCSTMEYPCIQE